MNVTPNYEQNSIVNLMSSILREYQIHSPYPPLSEVPREIFQKATSTVLFVIDGMGYNFLEKYGQNTILTEYLRTKLTSVFPSTTAAAMVAYYTGMAPKNTGIPSWFTYLKEVGMITKILPFTPRGSNKSLSEFGLSPEEIYNFPSLYNKSEIPQYFLMPNDLKDADLTTIIGQERNIIGYENIDELFTQIDEILHQEHDQKQFIFIYWPELDHSAHLNGVNHETTIAQIQLWHTKLEKWIKTWKIDDPHARFLITADHGLVDSTEKTRLFLSDYPDLAECLTLPLSGEARAPGFYVRSDRVNEFIQLVEKYFGHLGTLYSRQELLDSKLLGLGELHPKLPLRLGDYVLVFNDNYILKDFLPGEDREELIGNHGGLTEDEIFVPLIVI